MLISLIAAIGEHQEIGYQNKLLWHIKADLRNFKALTMGHHLVMGRKTFASLGKPLAGRPHLVLSRQAGIDLGGEVACVRSWEEAVARAEASGERELFVVGGGELYKLALPYAHKLYLSRIHASYPLADTFFPPFDASHWLLEEKAYHPAVSSEGAPAWTYQVFSKQASHQAKKVACR